MSRFTKAVAIADIQERVNARQVAHKFDLNNGTSQLWPRGADDRMKALIERAAAYGALRALEGVAQDIESGHLGVAAK